MSELIPIKFNKIMQSQSYTMFILGNEIKHFAIYTSPKIGQNLQTTLSKQKKTRPYTLDLMNTIFLGLNVKLLQVVINDEKDSIYFTRLFIEQIRDEKRQILEIDARPSDSLTLAFENDIGIFCKKDVFERIIPIEG